MDQNGQGELTECIWKLHGILFESGVLGKRKIDKTVNGDILMSHRLSMALRWMAGGNKMDISPNHGVSMVQKKMHLLLSSHYF